MIFLHLPGLFFDQRNEADFIEELNSIIASEVDAVLSEFGATDDHGFSGLVMWFAGNDFSDRGHSDGFSPMFDLNDGDLFVLAKNEVGPLVF